MKLENFVNQIKENRRLRERNRYRRSKKAGVLIPFVFDGKREPYMLLTKRTEELSTHRAILWVVDISGAYVNEN